VIPVPCRILLDRLADAYSSGDKNALASLYAESALISTAADPDAVVGKDEHFGRVDLLYRSQLIGSIERISIDDNGGLIRATARISTPSGRFQPAVEYVWLVTFEDELVYRQKALASREEALAIYGLHGVDLGMHLPNAQLV
jgi:hypothetical protein